MSKYVIEIPDDVQYVLLNGKADHKYYTAVHPIAELEELNSDYINEHFGYLQDDAYERGHGIGYQKGCEDGVKDGQNEAWEAARKIADMWTKIDNDELLEIFGITERIGYSTLRSLFEKQTASEAVATLKTCEEKQKSDELKVGDIVDWSGDKYIVSYINNDGRADLIYLECGSVCESVSPDCFTRTGKHYDIATILEDMKE